MAKASVAITVEDKLDKGLNQAKKSMMQFQQTCNKVGNALSSAFSVTAIIAGLTKLGSVMKDMAVEEAETQRQYTQLKIALNDTAGFNKVVSAIDSLSRKTVASKDDMEALASELAGMGANSEGIEKMLEASVALANVTGKDLNTAYTALYKSLSGTTKTLKTMGINVDDLTESELANGGAIDLVIEKYGELSDQVANDSVDQTIKNISKSVEDVRGALGHSLLNTITPALETLYGWLLKIEEWANGVETESNIKVANKQIYGVMKNGGSLVDFETEDLQNFLNTLKTDFTSAYGSMADRLNYINKLEATISNRLSNEKEAAAWARKGVNGPVAVDVEGNKASYGNASASDEDDTATDTDTIEEFFKKYTSSSIVLQTKAYEEIITNATDYQNGLDKNSEDYIALQQIIDSYNEKITDLTSVPEEDNVAGSTIVGFMVDSLGEVGEVASTLVNNMATMGPELGAIVTALEYVFEGFGEVIEPFVNEIVEYVLEPLREIGRVVGELLVPMFETIMPIISQISDLLISIFDSIGVAITPIIETLFDIIAPILQVIGNILEALTPVLKVFAKVIVTITGTIQYVVQILQHWTATLMNWLASIKILGWRPFKGLSMDDPGSPGSYSSYIQSKWDSIDAAFNSSGESETSSSTATSVSSAQYQGATSVTINIYQQAPVVGDNGMRQFASMIRSEFDKLDYYGVTA